jgi:hypothetical protein
VPGPLKENVMATVEERLTTLEIEMVLVQRQLAEVFPKENIVAKKADDKCPPPPPPDNHVTDIPKKGDKFLCSGDCGMELVICADCGCGNVADVSLVCCGKQMYLDQ